VDLAASRQPARCADQGFQGAAVSQDSVVTVGLRPRVEIKRGTWPFSARDLKRLEAWIALNLQTLIDFWEERIDCDDEVRARLRKLPREAPQKNAKARTSMLSRGGASAGVVGSSNAVWIESRARPSRSESKHLMRIASSRVMRGK
jgi:hypothetical protein